MSLPLAAAVSAGVAWVAWGAGTLTPSGTVAAWMIGLAVLYRTGWEGGAVLAVFFVTSNLVSRILPREVQPSGLDPKSDRRDLWQVFANGGPSAMAAAATVDPRLGLWLVTAGFAAAAADTWATAIGARSSVPPRLLWSGRQVVAGTSGGVTPAGCAGALLGASIVAATGAVAAGRLSLLPAGTLLGFAGMVADSWVGGVLQGRFHCSRCNLPSEWRVHRCGNPTRRTGGLGWLNNDGVNFFATALAVGVAWAAWRWLD